MKPFCERVVLFYEKFVTKLLKVFNFKSQALSSLSFLDPARSQQESPSVFEKVEENVPISFDKSAVKLEYREFSIDDEVTTSQRCCAVLEHDLAHGVIEVLSSCYSCPEFTDNSSFQCRQ